jgi:hypothetical protein
VKHSSASFLGLLLVACGIAVIGTACSSSSNASDPPKDYGGSCSALASRCHGIATELAKTCHELGHDGDDAKCGPKKEECLAACPPRVPDDDHDAATSDASDGSAEGGPDPICITYCACMKANCAATANYPFADESVCYGACAVYSAAERSCFQSFCVDAADGGAKDHACEHASGKLGVQECP